MTGVFPHHLIFLGMSEKIIKSTLKFKIIGKVKTGITSPAMPLKHRASAVKQYRSAVEHTLQHYHRKAFKFRCENHETCVLCKRKFLLVGNKSQINDVIALRNINNRFTNQHQLKLTAVPLFVFTEILKKQITALEGERDAAKAQLDTANETLKKFEGIDPQQIQTELQTYKTKAEEAEKKYTREMTQRDQRDWIGKKLDEYGVTSPYARRQLTSDIMAEDSGLSWKDGAYFGFDDFMKSAKEK